MLAEILIAIFIGIAAGTVTGITPGIHINLVSVILVSISAALLHIVQPITLAVFLIAMSITHTFTDALPSTFLGAPDAEMALNALPGHRMLLQGRGYDAVKLTVIGSLFSLMLVIALFPALIFATPYIYNLVKDFIGWILVAVIVYVIFLEKGLKKKIIALAIFLLSGFLGLAVFGIPNLDQPLFAMLSGLFGVSTLLISLKDKNNIPPQQFEPDSLKLEKGHAWKPSVAAVFSGTLTGLFPGLGGAQAALIGFQLIGNLGNFAFIILVAGINTANMAFSLVTLYAIDKPRNGSIVALQQIMETVTVNEMLIYVAVMLIVAGIAAVWTLKLAKYFAKFITKVNYQKICYAIIFFIVMMTIYFNGILGLLILFTATMLGMLPAFFSVKRSLAMGCLILPVICYFLL
jgi:putative membrane protein